MQEGSAVWEQPSTTQEGSLQVSGMEAFRQPSFKNLETHTVGEASCATDAAAVAAGSAFGTAEAALSAVLQGVELSHCGAELSPDVDVVQAHHIFDQLLIRPEDFASHGRELLASLVGCVPSVIIQRLRQYDMSVAELLFESLLRFLLRYWIARKIALRKTTWLP
jgi:hypothetical protein